VAISLEKPDLGEGQVFIKGRVTYYNGREYMMTYGIETYYVPEGEGVKLERGAGLDVLVRVDRFGNAVIEKLVN
ncbi:MAG: GDYXXLXY domain-containing protein, partial [Firmicutes bacterium]|nr:GDYXXLXY domain-containing protein [Bacillota bacterium]